MLLIYATRTETLSVLYFDVIKLTSCDTTQSRGSFMQMFWFVSTHSNFITTITLPTKHGWTHLVYKGCQRSYNACVHPPHPIKACTLNPWEQTQRLDLQHVQVWGVESLTSASQTGLCAVTSSPPLSPQTLACLNLPVQLISALSTPPMLAAAQLTATLYQPGTAFILKPLRS